MFNFMHFFIIYVFKTNTCVKKKTACISVLIICQWMYFKYLNMNKIGFDFVFQKIVYRI